MPPLLDEMNVNDISPLSHHSYARFTEDDDIAVVTREKEAACTPRLGQERCMWLIWSAMLLSVIIWQTLSSILYHISALDVKSSPSSYETGFETDLLVAVPSIEIKRRQFTGGIERDESGVLYLNTSGLAYVGSPSPDLDKLWERYEAAIELHTSHSETKTKEGVAVNTMEDGSSGWYRVSIDVIHSLHCVNQLRKAVYAEHYYPEKREDFWYTHMNHCIDHLRQSIECHSDLTPLPYTWDKERGVGTPVWTQEHTCRDFDSIFDWDDSRLAKPLFGNSDHPDDKT